MRTTVDLPPLVHSRAVALARERNQSLSAVVAELTARGLAASGEPVQIRTDPHTGLPVISLGRPVSSAEVAEMIDE